MPERVTSLDVARLAGVSRSAVSRAFTPGASVSKATAEKVRVAAEHLGYRPNILARSLLTGRSRVIGLVVAYLDGHFYPSVVEKLSNAFQAEGYHVLIFMASRDAGNLDQVAREMMDYQVDALVLASVEMTSDITKRCRDTGVPVVLFNRRQAQRGELAVVSDNVMGGRLVAEHFVSLGRERIAYIAGLDSASTQRDREAGFVDGLHSAGLKLFARGEGQFQPEQARDAVLKMFRDGSGPDAIFAASDAMAFSVIDTLRSDLGLRVPEDVAVAGFDDVPIAAWPAYRLTSVRQDVDAMVRATVDLTVSRIEGEQTAGPLPMSVSLSVRSSTVG